MVADSLAPAKLPCLPVLMLDNVEQTLNIEYLHSIDSTVILSEPVWGCKLWKQFIFDTVVRMPVVFTYGEDASAGLVSGSIVQAGISERSFYLLNCWVLVDLDHGDPRDTSLSLLGLILLACPNVLLHSIYAGQPYTATHRRPDASPYL